MHNSEYIEKMFTINDKVYIDTSTLMEMDSMEAFIDNIRSPLHRLGKKLILLPFVSMELDEHAASDSEEKSIKAKFVQELMSENPDLFDVIEYEYQQEHFADPQILATLTMSKMRYCQLLIANDRKLAKNAYELNAQESCVGRKIMVCYVNWSGNLQCCKCVSDSSAVHESEPFEQSQTSNTPSDAPVLSPATDPAPTQIPAAPVMSTAPATSSSDSGNSTIGYIITGIVSATAGIAIGCSSEKLKDAFCSVCNGISSFCNKATH